MLRGLRVLLGLSVLLLVSVTWASADGWVLFDDFSRKDWLPPSHWYASSNSKYALESGRNVFDEKLHINLVGYGRHQEGNQRRMSSEGMGLRLPMAIKSLKADLSIRWSVISPCQDNQRSGQVRAQLVMSLFNDGSGDKSDSTGNVMALIEKVDDEGEGPFVRAMMLRCDSPGCGTASHQKAILFKKPWAEKQEDTFQIEWDLKHQVVFTRNPGLETEEIHIIKYDPSLKPVSLQRQSQTFRAKVHAPDCLALRRFSSLHMTVDNIMFKPLTPSENTAILKAVKPRERAAAVTRELTLGGKGRR